MYDKPTYINGQGLLVALEQPNLKIVALVEIVATPR